MGATHHMHGTPTHTTWRKMRERCNNPNATQFKWYGGKGVRVCPRWDESFEAFLSDMGLRPDGMTIDRIDTDGDYEPSNCRWADHLTQARNQKKTIVCGDISLREACEIAGVSFSAAYGRYLAGNSIEEMLDPSPRKKKKNAETLCEYAKMRRQGKGHREIGEHFGLAPQSLEAWSKDARRRGIL